MRSVIIILFLSILTSSVMAQPNMDGFESTPYIANDGYRIFFDESVSWGYGGIIMDPAMEFWQNEPQVDAWLVLVNPTADAISGFRFGLELTGSHTVLSSEVIGNPSSVQIENNQVNVAFDPPLPLDGSALPLIRWSLLNLSHAPLEFYLWPANGDDVPVYFNGNGETVAGNTFNGDYHNFEAPITVLNGAVTPVETMAWEKVKALYK